jgi:hypothetical protein
MSRQQRVRGRPLRALFLQPALLASGNLGSLGSCKASSRHPAMLIAAVTASPFWVAIITVAACLVIPHACEQHRPMSPCFTCHVQVGFRRLGCSELPDIGAGRQHKHFCDLHLFCRSCMRAWCALSASCRSLAASAACRRAASAAARSSPSCRLTSATSSLAAVCDTLASRCSRASWALSSVFAALSSCILQSSLSIGTRRAGCNDFS